MMECKAVYHCASDEEARRSLLRALDEAHRPRGDIPGPRETDKTRK